jgi:hypothetical protein
LGERHLEYEKREEDILFFLSDHVRVSVKYNSPTKVEAQMWRLDVLLPPDVGNINAASFRKRLVRDGMEAFNRGSKEGENMVPKLEEELGLVANALRSKSEDKEGEEGKLTLLDILKGMHGPSMMDLLIGYGREGELFHGADGEPYATVKVGDHHETYHLKSKGYKNWLRHKYYAEEKKRLEEIGKPEESPAVPRSQVINDALAQLEAICQFEGPEHEVHVRMAEHEGAVYLDLADAKWRVVRIDPSGWQVVSNPPVKFLKAKGILPLPVPAQGGSVDKLRGLINLKDDDHDGWRLTVAWLVQALRPRGPYPVLILQGEQGSAKSTIERLLRALVDPSTAPLRTTPRNEHDLYIAATSAWVVAFDNISNLQPWLSDALCRLSTGGGFSTRTLYENREQELFDAMRPVILNGISDVATRPDLLDRAIVLTLPPISEESRRPESEVWGRFEEDRPAILGALLDAVSMALRELSNTKLDSVPRMADFALWATASEHTFGWKPQAFMQAYARNREQANDLALETEPVAGAVLKLMESRDEWISNATELWKALGEKVDEEVKYTKAWPAAPHTLTNRLKRLAPALRRTGIEYLEDRVGHKGTKVKKLVKVPVEQRQQRRQRQRSEKDLQNQGLDADASADASVGADASADASKNGKCQQGMPANREIFTNADAADALSRKPEDEWEGEF